MTEKRSHRRCLLITHAMASDDPPTRQTIDELVRQGFHVTVVQLSDEHTAASAFQSADTVEIHFIRGPKWQLPIRALYNLVRWFRFKSVIRRTIKKLRPDVVITVMLHALAALPKRASLRQRLVACVYDIPSLELAGKLDRVVVRKGWARLRDANVVWSSDIYKAQLAQQFGNLKNLPVVCHNCPPRPYLNASPDVRNGWLRSELRRFGAEIGETEGSVLLRAGAVGDYGGIEETLEGMIGLPKDHVFLMMGRPPAEYRRRLVALIEKLGLKKRAFLWDRPNDETWNKALLGADIGHLIHGPFPPGPMTQLYQLNSSLSNNRLFSYMAAGLPIICYDDPRMKVIYDEVRCFRVARIANLRSDIAQMWGELGCNSALRHTLGAAGRNAHRSKYCWDIQFKPILDAILDLPPHAGAGFA